MATIKLQPSGKVVIKDGKVACECCLGFQMTILYSWEGTGQPDLDTSTRGFDENLGYDCTNQEIYLQWITGDDTSVDGNEQVDARVNDARKDGLWTSSYNIECFAGWYAPRGGSGPAELIVTYKNKTKQKTISPGQQNSCAATLVATITFYAQKQPDDSFFEIL